MSLCYGTNLLCSRVVSILEREMNLLFILKGKPRLRLKKLLDHDLLEKNTNTFLDQSKLIA